MNRIYQAFFAIDCGVSPGFGIKYPDFVRRTEKISAEDSQEAYRMAMNMERQMSWDYLSNPETCLTLVQLTSLTSLDGAVSFDASKAVAKCTTPQHFLPLEDFLRTSQQLT